MSEKPPIAVIASTEGMTSLSARGSVRDVCLVLEGHIREACAELKRPQIVLGRANVSEAELSRFVDYLQDVTCEAVDEHAVNQKPPLIGGKAYVAMLIRDHGVTGGERA